MLLFSITKFVLIFFLLPTLNSVVLYQFLKKIFSPYYILIFTLAISPAFNTWLLFSLYFANLHASDLLYLGTIILINILPCSCLFLKDRNLFREFFIEITNVSKKNFLIKYIIALSIIFVVSIAIFATPYNNDILEYFEIGKIFYKEKHIFYPVLPHYSENLFSSHASHPPFFTILQSLCFLIQGTTKYHFISNCLHGFYIFLFIIIMLTIMQENLVLAVVCLFCGIFTSHYAYYAYFYPSGLDIFRLTYHLFAFFTLQQLISKPESKILVVFLGIFCGLSLCTHSSGLLFFILILPIFLATYTPKNISSKYYALITTILIAIVIGGWQYLINIYHYGSPVSDDVLLWSKHGYHSYMRYERDLYCLRNMLNKFLKLFYPSDLEYGYFYFVLSILGVLTVKKQICELKNAFLNFFSLQNTSLAWYMPYLLYIISFYSVVLLSISLRQDLIIKNFRYLLSPYPFVIIVTYALIPFLPIIKEIWECLKKIPVIILKFLQFNKLLALLTVLFVVWSPLLFLFVNKKLENSIQSLSTVKIVEYLSQNLSENEVVFAFDRANLYNSLPNAKINFYLDDSTIGYFDITNIKELYDTLKRNNVKYIFTASYRPFILNKSAFSNLIASPVYTEIIVSEQNYTLYKLNSTLQNNPTKKLKASILPKSQYTDISLKQNTEYLVEVTQLSSEPDTFYTLMAFANGYSYANLTHNDSTQFRVKTPIVKGQGEDVVLIFSITAKDKLLKLKIDIFEEE
ncbi:MAG: hypothetical protein RCG15_05780 [Candidatus Rickettsia vulgarisii]